jgi:hypothetical protein
MSHYISIKGGNSMSRIASNHFLEMLEILEIFGNFGIFLEFFGKLFDFIF